MIRSVARWWVEKITAPPPRWVGAREDVPDDVAGGVDGKGTIPKLAPRIVAGFYAIPHTKATLATKGRNRGEQDDADAE
jgi:hypothetical protein